MILTVTPNPSLDRTLRVPPLVRGGVQRATSVTSEAGGKGINVARALATEGHATLAVAPLSATSAATMTALLGPAPRLEAVPIAGDVRLNVSLVEDDGTVTKVNEPGPLLSAAEASSLLDRTAALADGATWVAGCGSLPPGVPAEFYATLARRLPAGVSLAVDADGDPLRACRGEPIALIKPNLAELEALVGRPLPTLGAVADAADELVGEGIGSVLISMGRDGAVLVEGGQAIHAEARIDKVRNTVGAGDALLAGFLAGGGGPAALGLAVAWSVAACRSPGTEMGSVSAADRAAVSVHAELDVDRRLAR